MNERMFGTVKKFWPDRGYGFIKRDDGQPDDWFPASSLRNANLSTIERGARVSYELELGRNGRLQAVKLKLTSVGHINDDGPVETKPGPVRFGEIMSAG